MSDSNFEIRRQALGTPNQSGVLLQPTGVTSLPRGTAVAFDGSLNLVEAEPGSPFIGFLRREVNTVGPTLADSVFGLSVGAEPRLDLPELFGSAVSAEAAIEVEAEGADYLVAAGDGAVGPITNATAAKTGLTFRGGKFSVAQTGERVEFVLAAQLPPVNAGFARIRAVRFGGA